MQYIYLFWFTDQEPVPGKPLQNVRIKIGRTNNVGKRLEEHRTQGNLGIRPAVIEAACAVVGTPGDEGSLKSYFGSDLWEGTTEVFHPSAALTGYVRWLRDQYFVWVPDDPHCPPVEDQPAVDASCWLPTAERIKPPPDGLLPFMTGPLGLPERQITADDFYTGETIIRAVRQTFGGVIDLDPASHPIANEVVQATQFYGKAENGLTKPWAGNVWLNPPFSQWKLWVAKILAELDAGHVTALCVLAACRTLTARYFTPLLKATDFMCVTDGRQRFWGYQPDLNKGSSPTDGHVIMYFGARSGRDLGARFLLCFSPLGTVFKGPRVRKPKE